MAINPGVYSEAWRDFFISEEYINFAFAKQMMIVFIPNELRLIAQSLVGYFLYPYYKDTGGCLYVDL